MTVSRQKSLKDTHTERTTLDSNRPKTKETLGINTAKCPTLEHVGHEQAWGRLVKAVLLFQHEGLVDR